MASAVLGFIGIVVTGLNAWLALAMRQHRSETQAGFSKLELRLTQKLDDAVAQVRRDTNGSYMRANEVREIVKRLEAEIQAVKHT